MSKTGLDMDYVRRAQKEVKAAKGGGGFVKTADGENVVRLFTFESSVTGKTALERRIKKHYGLDGAHPLCQKTPAPTGEAKGDCESCDRVAEIRREDGEQAAKRVSAQTKCVVNCIPLVIGGVPVEGPPKVMTWDMPIMVFEFVLAALEDPDGDINDYFGINGRDLRVVYDSKADVSRKYKANFRNAEKSAVTTARLKKEADRLMAEVKDLHLLASLQPEWWNLDQKGEASGVAPASSSDDDDDDDDKETAAPAASGDDDEGESSSTAASSGDDDEAAEPPADDEAAAPQAPPLPKGWKAFWSAEKGKFYFKKPDGTTTWKAPEAEPAAPTKAAPAPAPAKKAAATKKAAAPAKGKATGKSKR